MGGKNWRSCRGIHQREEWGFFATRPGKINNEKGSGKIHSTPSSTKKGKNHRQRNTEKKNEARGWGEIADRQKNVNPKRDKRIWGDGPPRGLVPPVESGSGRGEGLETREERDKTNGPRERSAMGGGNTTRREVNKTWG